MTTAIYQADVEHVSDDDEDDSDVIMMIEKIVVLMLTPTHVPLPATTDQQTMNATF